MARTLFTICAAILLGLGAAPATWADINSDTGPGCGLGKMIWSQPKFTGSKHIMQQVLVSTTNGSFGSQTFGISFGTSGCTNDGVISSNQKVNVFADVNLGNLRQEIAQGRGEYLASFTSLLGVPMRQQHAFYAFAQARYAALFPSEQTTAAEMLAALDQELSVHPEFLPTAN